jgi:hypothetical protein
LGGGGGALRRVRLFGTPGGTVLIQWHPDDPSEIGERESGSAQGTDRIPEQLLDRQAARKRFSSVVARPNQGRGMGSEPVAVLNFGRQAGPDREDLQTGLTAYSEKFYATWDPEGTLKIWDGSGDASAPAEWSSDTRSSGQQVINLEFNNLAFDRITQERLPLDGKYAVWLPACDSEGFAVVSLPYFLNMISSLSHPSEYNTDYGQVMWGNAKCPSNQNTENTVASYRNDSYDPYFFSALDPVYGGGYNTYLKTKRFDPNKIEWTGPVFLVSPDRTTIARIDPTVDLRNVEEEVDFYLVESPVFQEIRESTVIGIGQLGSARAAYTGVPPWITRVRWHSSRDPFPQDVKDNTILEKIKVGDLIDMYVDYIEEGVKVRYVLNSFGLSLWDPEARRLRREYKIPVRLEDYEKRVPHFDFYSDYRDFVRSYPPRSTALQHALELSLKRLTINLVESTGVSDKTYDFLIEKSPPEIAILHIYKKDETLRDSLVGFSRDFLDGPGAQDANSKKTAELVVFLLEILANEVTEEERHRVGVDSLRKWMLNTCFPFNLLFPDPTGAVGKYTALYEYIVTKPTQLRVRAPLLLDVNYINTVLDALVVLADYVRFHTVTLQTPPGQKDSFLDTAVLRTENQTAVPGILRLASLMASDPGKMSALLTILPDQELAIRHNALSSSYRQGHHKDPALSALYYSSLVKVLQEMYVGVLNEADAQGQVTSNKNRKQKEIVQAASSLSQVAPFSLLFEVVRHPPRTATPVTATPVTGRGPRQWAWPPRGGGGASGVWLPAGALALVAAASAAIPRYSGSG